MADPEREPQNNIEDDTEIPDLDFGSPLESPEKKKKPKRTKLELMEVVAEDEKTGREKRVLELHAPKGFDKTEQKKILETIDQLKSNRRAIIRGGGSVDEAELNELLEEYVHEDIRDQAREYLVQDAAKAHEKMGQSKRLKKEKADLKKAQENLKNLMPEEKPRDSFPADKLMQEQKFKETGLPPEGMGHDIKEEWRDMTKEMKRGIGLVNSEKAGSDLKRKTTIEAIRAWREIDRYTKIPTAIKWIGGLFKKKEGVENTEETMEAILPTDEEREEYLRNNPPVMATEVTPGTEEDESGMPKEELLVFEEELRDKLKADGYNLENRFIPQRTRTRKRADYIVIPSLSGSVPELRIPLDGFEDWKKAYMDDRLEVPDLDFQETKEGESGISRVDLLDVMDIINYNHEEADLDTLTDDSSAEQIYNAIDQYATYPGLPDYETVSSM